MEKGEPYTLLLEIQLGAAIIENSMKIPQNIKNRTTINPAIPLLDVCLKDMKTGSQRDNYAHFY